MEGTFLKLLGEFGIIPVMILLIMIVWFLLREVKKEVGGVNHSVKGLKSDISNVKGDLLERLNDLKARSDEKDEALQRKIEDFERRIYSMEKDLVSKEEMYRLVSGWRSEITSLNDLIVQGFKNEGERNGKGA